jgi:hypothetical protein
MPKHSELTTVAQEMERDLRTICEIIRRPLDAAVARRNLTGPNRAPCKSWWEPKALV